MSFFSFRLNLLCAVLLSLTSATFAQATSVPFDAPIVEPTPAPETPTPEISVRPLAKFEPPSGCYIGAFIENDYTVKGDIDAWEQMTRKKHASYFTYVGYGRPFPEEFVEKNKAAGAAPHIAFEPNNGLAEVVDGPYLRAWARDAARARCPIFLRWASEMNGKTWTAYGNDAALYIEKFRMVAQVMREEAPNVAMVWTPFVEPQNYSAQSKIDSYYPGDEWVDWVGINTYAVYVNDGDPLRPASQKDILQGLSFIVEKYGARKPIHVSEFAATIYCKGSAADTVDFAIARMNQFYGAIRTQFPGVKAVNWFCWDTIRANHRNNNYSIIDDGRALANYRKVVADAHFLAKVAYDPNQWPINIKPGTTLGANGITLRSGTGMNAEEILHDAGANGENVNQVNSANAGALVVSGVRSGEQVHGALELRAQLPPETRPRSVSWQIDGRTISMTNVWPYALSLPARRLMPGFHSVRIVARFDNGPELSSADVEFEVMD